MKVRLLLAALAVAALSVAAGLAGTSAGRPLPHAKHCRIFPKNNAWNQRVDKLPRARNSDAIVRSIGPGDAMHADFGSGRYEGRPIGIPYTTVGRHQKRVKVSFEYADE